MYVASKIPEEDFAIFEEIRTREEPEGIYIFYSNSKTIGFNKMKHL